MALLPEQRMTKPHGVLVTTGGKNIIKEFDTPAEREGFIEQLKKFPDVVYRSVDRQLFGKPGRATSRGFTTMTLKDGTVTDHCIRVPKIRGMLFCTECHEYRVFEDLPSDFGNVATRCPVCTMSVNDFYIKTANGLWDRSTGEEENLVKSNAELLQDTLDAEAAEPSYG